MKQPERMISLDPHIKTGEPVFTKENGLPHHLSGLVRNDSGGGKTFPEVTTPKSVESANSTTPAYSFVPLIFTRGDTRGGAHSLIHDL